MLIDGFWAGLKATGDMVNTVASKTSEAMTPLVEQSGAKEMMKNAGDAMKQSTTDLMNGETIKQAQTSVSGVGSSAYEMSGQAF